MKTIVDRIVGRWGETLRYLISAVFAFVVLSVNAEGTGPLGYPNLLVNHDFDDAVITGGGTRARFREGKVTLTGWNGGSSEAGVAAANDGTWMPVFSNRNDDYRVYIQMQNGWNDDKSYIEQTVTAETSGRYAFSVRYATRQNNNSTYTKGGKLGISVRSGGVTEELDAVVFNKDDKTVRIATRFVTLEAGQSYTFRLHGVANVSNASDDRTAMIDYCALELLPDYKGPFGYSNLFINPDFEKSSVASDSNNGTRGYFKDGKVSSVYWTGHGRAGVAYGTANDVWQPYLPDADDYRVYIQMTTGADNNASYIEQTVTPETTGLYAFTCQYATRWKYNTNASRLGFSVISGNVTNELDAAVLLADDSRYRNVMRYVTLEAGQSYTFRIHGVAESGSADVDRAAIIGSCSLEFLPPTDRVISSDYYLTADEDWSSQTVEIAAGAKVNLQGHTLKIGYVRPGGNGAAPEFTDATFDPGVLRVTVPSGETIPNPGWCATGNATFVKEGPGTLAWRGGTIDEEVAIVVSNGVFRLDTWPMNVFGAGGTFTISNKGQYDIHFGWDGMESPSYARTFYIKGNGPDGSGAIVNDALRGRYARHFQDIVMTGDATIGGRSVIDLRTAGGIDCGGHTLTVKNTGRLLLETGTSLDNCADLILDGGVFQPCNASTINISGAVIIKNNGALGSYTSGADGKMNIYADIIASAGVGTVRSENGSYTLNDSSITVKSGATLNCMTKTNAWYYCVITNETGATMNFSGSSGQFSIYRKFFKNDGTVNHTGAELYLGNKGNTTQGCSIENNGTIKTSGGKFQFKEGSTMTGTGTLELAGGSPLVAGDLSGFTGTILLSGGTATISSADDFPGTLRLKNGALSSGTSLAGFTGTTVVDVAAHTGAFNIDGKNWFTHASGTYVLVDAGNRELQYGDQILSWSDMPLGVRFKLLGDYRGELRKTNSGVVYAKRRGTLILIR